MILETYFANLLDVLMGGAGITVYAISIALLYASLIAGFAALRNLELHAKLTVLVLAAAIFAHFAIILLTIYPLAEPTSTPPTSWNACKMGLALGRSFRPCPCQN